MLAMTNKNNVRAGENLSQENPTRDTEPPSRSTGRTTLPSGLSALIQAATAQLTALGDDAGSPGRPRRVVTMTQSEETGSSDGEHNMEQPVRTPTIVPEPDPHRQSFPELLMTLALDASNVDVISFLPDGKFFALRTKEFSDSVMTKYFAVASFVEFLDATQDWGFTRVLKPDNCSGIEVFRHPSFVKGDWERCACIKFGESPTSLRISALPESARIDYTLSDDSVNSAAHSKRRLSPGFLSRRESETSVSSQKQKVDGFDQGQRLLGRARSSSNADSEAAESLIAVSYTNVSRTDDLRSIALSITTEKLKIRNDVAKATPEEPLVQRAVESATHTIVTDAIETLLRDEGHTKETYLKHEKELSRSSLPGVVPLSTQLFSPRGGAADTEKPTGLAGPVDIVPVSETIEKCNKVQKVDADVLTGIGAQIRQDTSTS